MDALLEIMQGAPEIEAGNTCCEASTAVNDGPCLAVARDEAFCFYYEENLMMLRNAGIRIKEFSPLHDSRIPEDADGLLLGGGQENNFRSGTECVPLICGFGAAVAALCGKVEQNYKNAKALQNYLIEKCSETGGVTVNFASGSPYITSIAVEGLKSEVLLHFLEENGIYVSSGSACSKGKKSSVIKEFRVPEKLSDSVLRISFSNRTTNDDIDALLEAITRAQGRLARMK